MVYLWCETSARAAVAQITTAVILGLPTRLYDAAMIEWNSLTGGALDKNGNPILSLDSPWRTDELSNPAFPNKQASISPRGAEFTDVAPRIVDAFGETTHAVIAADKAYLAPETTSETSSSASTSSSGGGSVILPTNPCGG